MPKLAFTLENLEPDYLAQVEYSLSFASERIGSYRIDEGRLEVEVDAESTADVDEVKGKIEQLLRRYDDAKFGLKSVVHFQQEVELERRNAYTELVAKRWVEPVGQGHVLLRGLAADLFRVVDRKVLAEVAAPFDAEEEYYPSTILCETLDAIQHFTSFPEHVDFVGHLREDVEKLTEFSALCKDEGWKPEHHEGRQAPPDFAISPSCCYHCYEGMKDWEIEGDGRCVTMILNCHRYEGKNLTTLSRLRAFHMREVVWLGRPQYVIESRKRADAMLIEWARKWQLDASFENANDMFFTDDYSVKASFQRQQEAKRELRLTIPWEDRRISCASSNFHAATFGRAFGIRAGKRPAVSACMGWGGERWVYAVFSQYGLDPAKWPEGIRDDLERYR